MNYTLHQVPESLDRAIRERAAAEQKSLNEVLLDALQKGLSLEASNAQKQACSYSEESTAALEDQQQLEPDRAQRRDLSSIFSGEPLEPEVLQALEDQRRIDPELWD